MFCELNQLCEQCKIIVQHPATAEKGVESVNSFLAFGVATIKVYMGLS